MVRFAVPARAVVAGELAVLTALVLLTTAGLAPGLPTVGAVVVAAAALVSIRIYGHTIPARLLLWVAQRRGYDLKAHVAEPVDIRRGDMLIGVQRDRVTATAVIELGGTAYTPTVLSDRRQSVTHNTVPLSVLADQLAQPGPLVLAGIDIVSAGSRVSGARGYAPVYSAVLAEQPAAGQRRSYAIIRLDMAASMHGLALRDSAEDAVAAVAERIVCALRQRNCRVNPLSAAAINNLANHLAGPLIHGDTTAYRGFLDNAGRSYWASYYYSPEDITTANLNEVWAWPIQGAVSTVTISSAPGGAVRVGAMVRAETGAAPTSSPAAYLNPIPAQQIRAAASCVPGAPRLAGLPTVECTNTADLQIPVGPAGVLVGTVTDCDQQRPVLLPLTDPVHNTRIRFTSGDSAFLRQVLLRAAAVGHSISVYTDRPEQWAGIEAPLIEIHESAAAIPATPATIVVKDRADGQPQSSATTIVSLPTDSSYPSGVRPDIEFSQTASNQVLIRAASLEWVVTPVSFPDERPYLGLAAPTSDAISVAATT